ncbi:hypothetical protein STEG23_008805, partial [Scotinomys teguina]
MGIPKDGLQNLANTLEGDKDLNSPRELSAEAEKELAIVEKTIREAHVDRVNPELKCILVILPSRHSPTGILMQREHVILEWIFLPCKPNKKLKTDIEKISDLIHKGYISEEITNKFCGYKAPKVICMAHMSTLHKSSLANAENQKNEVHKHGVKRNIPKSQKSFKEPQKNCSLSHSSDEEGLCKTLHVTFFPSHSSQGLGKALFSLGDYDRTEFFAFQSQPQRTIGCLVPVKLSGIIRVDGLASIYHPNGMQGQNVSEAEIYLQLINLQSEDRGQIPAAETIWDKALEVPGIQQKWMFTPVVTSNTVNGSCPHKYTASVLTYTRH